MTAVQRGFVTVDIEADGLLDTVTQIHVIVTRCHATGEVLHWYNVPRGSDISFYCDEDEHYGGTIEDGVRFLLLFNIIVAHNGLAYDFPLLQKFFPWFKRELSVRDNQYFTESGRVLDTMVVSQMMDPERDSHGVASYGRQFGVPKPDHEDWSVLTPDMINRCHQDVIIQDKILTLYIDNITSPSWKLGVELEMTTLEVCNEMCENRCTLDRGKLTQLKRQLVAEMADIEASVHPLLPLRPVDEGGFKHVFKKDGEYKACVAAWIQTNDIPSHMWPAGDFTRIRFERVSLWSSPQIKHWLLQEGWVPDEWNYKKDKHNKLLRNEVGQLIKTSPTITEPSLEALAEKTGNPAVCKIVRFFQCKHRLGLIVSKGEKGTGLLERLDVKNQIKPGIIPCGTPTARARHKIIINIPGNDSFYGPELRSCFIARPGYVLVGWDASALEARIEAHYTYPYDNGAYATELLQGDIHSKNAEVFNCTRKLAKNGKYCLSYGGSANKLAQTLGKSAEEASQLYDDFWSANSALKSLKDDLEVAHRARKKRPYVKAIDGRHLYIRYKHALVNSLFQAGGSIVVKMAFCRLAKEVKIRGWDVKFVTFNHDEVQAEVRPNLANQYGQLAVECLQWAGRYAKLNVKLDGEYKIGKNWSETH